MSEKVLFFAVSCAIIFYTHIIIYNFRAYGRLILPIFKTLGERFRGGKINTDCAEDVT